MSLSARHSLDVQHSLFTVETIGHIAQAALGCGIAPLVRVRGCDRNIDRQAGFIRKGARFITTNSDIAFIMAEASRVTRELRKALDAAV